MLKTFRQQLEEEEERRKRRDKQRHPPRVDTDSDSFSDEDDDCRQPPPRSSLRTPSSTCTSDFSMDEDDVGTPQLVTKTMTKIGSGNSKKRSVRPPLSTIVSPSSPTTPISSNSAPRFAGASSSSTRSRTVVISTGAEDDKSPFASSHFHSSPNDIPDYGPPPQTPDANSNQRIDVLRSAEFSKGGSATPYTCRRRSVTQQQDERNSNRAAVGTLVEPHGLDMGADTVVRQLVLPEGEERDAYEDSFERSLPV